MTKINSTPKKPYISPEIIEEKIIDTEILGCTTKMIRLDIPGIRITGADPYGDYVIEMLNEEGEWKKERNVYKLELTLDISEVVPSVIIHKHVLPKIEKS